MQVKFPEQDGGRVTKADAMAAQPPVKAAMATSQPQEGKSTSNVALPGEFRNCRRNCNARKMSNIRKTIANRLVQAQTHSCYFDHI